MNKPLFILLAVTVLAACEYHPRAIVVDESLSRVSESAGPEFNPDIQSFACAPATTCELSKEGRLTILTRITGVPPRVINLPATAGGIVKSLRLHDSVVAYQTYTGKLFLVTDGNNPTLESPGTLSALSPALDGHGLVYVEKTSCIVHRDLAGPARWRSCPGISVSALHVTDDAVYVGGQRGEIIALDRTSGSKHWRFDTKGFNISFALGRSALFAAADEDGVYALDIARGSELWHTSLPDLNRSIELGKTHLIVRDNTGSLLALNTADGTVVQRRELGLRSPDTVKID